MRTLFWVMVGMSWCAVALANGMATSSSGAKMEEAPEQTVWRGVPIRVDLKLGMERIVQIPGASQLRAGLLGGPVPGLQIQPLGDHLYILAKQPFASTRVLAQSEGSAPVLLDLAADDKFAAGPSVAILTGSVPSAASAGATSPRETSAKQKAKPVGYVALVRHAAQSLYAPSRLIPVTDGSIVRASLRKFEHLHLVRGAHLKATGVAAWRANGPTGPLWVNAVQLQNRLDRAVVLDPRDLRGDWRAASFQHARLGPAGDVTDTTTVYLISSDRFEKALGPWLAHDTGEDARP